MKFQMEEAVVIHADCAKEYNTRIYEPLREGHPAVGISCPLCNKALKVGDITKLMALAFLWIPLSRGS